MLKIRLKRIGRKKVPIYKIVLMEALSKRNGKAIKELGFYNSLSKDFEIDLQTLEYYLKNGARPTNTVRHLIRNKLKTY